MLRVFPLLSCSADYQNQIMIVDSGEMFTDFTGTLHRVANHFGLPPHDFEYNSRHQHSSGSCERRRPELFAKGARYAGEHSPGPPAFHRLSRRLTYFFFPI